MWKKRFFHFYCHKNNYVFFRFSLLLALIYYSNYTFFFFFYKPGRNKDEEENFMFSPFSSFGIMSANKRLYCWLLAVKLRRTRGEDKNFMLSKLCKVFPSSGYQILSGGFNWLCYAAMSFIFRMETKHNENGEFNDNLICLVFIQIELVSSEGLMLLRELNDYEFIWSVLKLHFKANSLLF